MYLNKKIITALVLLLIVALPLFFLVTVSVKQKFLQHQRNEKFNNHPLRTITISAQNIYWIKPGKEILFDGKLFDVKSYTTKDKTITLIGFFDHKEDKLVQQIVKLAKQDNTTSNPMNNSGIKFIFFPVYIAQPHIDFGLTWKSITRQYHCFKEMLPAASILLPSPPPKV